VSDVEGRHRPAKALQGQISDLLQHRPRPDRGGDPSDDEDLRIFRLVAQTCRQVADCADRRVTGPIREPDLAKRRVTPRDPDTEAKFATAGAPPRDQFARRLAHGLRNLDRALCRVGTWDWVVEEHHDAVTSNWATSGPKAP
jgi:hypothetical protein